MTVADAINQDRIAQQLIAEYKLAVGSPPSYPSGWTPLWGCKIDKIEINRDSKSSTVKIWFPFLRWDNTSNIFLTGNLLRITTAEHSSSRRSIVFQGFITSFLSDFTGGSDSTKSHERCALVASDYRWLLAVTSPLVGQVIRGPDDYTDVTDVPISDSCTYLVGRRTIFNKDGRPNKSPYLLTLSDSNQQVPVFAPPESAIPWTARDMLCYILSPLCNRVYNYFPLNPSTLGGLYHNDFNRVLSHIVVEGLNVIDAVELVCKHLGWGFRQDYTNSGKPTLVFYKSGSASGHSRSNEKQTILHELHAPDVDETITAAVSEGRKLLWSMALNEDIAGLINEPWGIGSPHRFEFTAELVPAWLDSELVPDTSEEFANLFFTEADLQEFDNPNDKDYYKYYHPRGFNFLRNVARQWSLNESGQYSNADSFDRGMPFDFSTVIDSQYILDSYGKRLYALFKRQLLPCLTIDKDSLNTVGIKVEFSFDGGQTWQVLNASISSLSNECGIYIDEANLAELVDQNEGELSGGVLDGTQLNYWTSLCDDILNGRSFKNGQWHTRVRVTASVQMDKRINFYVPNISSFGSPFRQAHLYDFSDRYSLLKRSAVSIFSGSDLPAYEVDSTDVLINHLEAIRRANQDASISGLFVLERLWLGDGSGRTDFAIGDGIKKITGREYPLFARSEQENVYPEIIQIVYLPDEQRMELVTRDLRFVEVSL